MMRIALLALAVLAPGCPPAPQTLPPESGPPAELVDAARSQTVCAHLAALDCAEGRSPNCTSVFLHAQDSGLTDLHPACLASAATKQAARACGSVRCP